MFQKIFSGCKIVIFWVNSLTFWVNSFWVKSNFTKFCNIVCGIPQGSILGPLFFLIYVNDLYMASPKIAPVMFADDTNLFLSDRHTESLFMNIFLCAPLTRHFLE